MYDMYFVYYIVRMASAQTDFYLAFFIDIVNKKCSVDLCGSLGFINIIRCILLATTTDDYILTRSH